MCTYVCMCMCGVCVLTRLCECDVCCGVYCVFCWWCVVRLGMRKLLRVCVQDASVCSGKAPACVEHAGVFRIHTETS